MKNIPILCIIFCMLVTLAVPAVPVFAEDTDPETAQTTEATETTQATEPPPAILPEGQIPSAVTGTDASVSNGCHTIDAQNPLGGSERMLETAKASLLYERNSGTLLYADNPDGRVYPASLVKIMTALLLVEENDPDRVVTVTQSAVDAVPSDAVSIDIRAGETFTLRDLLYCMLVASANDACAVVAEAISGSQEAFVARMNQRAKELGCTGTNFVNPHGIHHEEQYSTARDLGRILLAALEYEEFREAFGAATYTVEAEDADDTRYLVTGNYFISRDSGVVKFYDTRVTGGRTGAISTKDRSMATTAVSGDMELMSIVMGAEGTLESDGYSLHYLGNFEETMDLLDWGFRNFTVAQILHEGKSIAQFPVTDGQNHVVGRPIQTVYSALPYGASAEHLSWRYDQSSAGLTAPVAEGARIGTVQVWYGGVCLAQSDMVSMNPSLVRTAEDDQPGEADAEGGLSWFLTILGMIFAVVIGLVLILIVLRLVRRWLRRLRRRRRMKNRRRSR